MFDELRDQSSEDSAAALGMPSKSKPIGPETRVFGMTSGQRLIISIMLFATVFIVGLMCLLITGRVWLI